MLSRLLLLLLLIQTAFQSALRHPEDAQIFVGAGFVRACSEYGPCAIQATVHGTVNGAAYTIVLEVQGPTQFHIKKWIFDQSHYTFNYTIPTPPRGLHTVRISVLDAHPETPDDERLLSTGIRSVDVCAGQCAAESPPASQDASDAGAPRDDQGRVPPEDDREKPRRIAHCITGAVRTLTEPRVYESIKDNLIDALGGASDVFFFLENGDTSPRGGFAGPLPVESILAVTDRLRAVRVEFQEDDIVFLRCQKTGKTPDRTYTSPWTAQLLKWRRCFDMIQEHEYRQNMPYDWIVKSRPDMRYEHPVKQDWDASKVYLGGIFCPDCLVALPRTHLYDVATLDNAACTAPSRLPAWSKLMELAGKAAFDPNTREPTPTVYPDTIDTSQGVSGQLLLFAQLDSRNVSVEIWEVPGMDTVRTPEAAALIAEVGWYATTDTVIGEDREILSPHAVARAIERSRKERGRERGESED